MTGLQSSGDQASIGPRGATIACMVGLASSGKTTYVAALWNLIQQTETGSELHLRAFPTDLHYYNGLSERWLQCERVERTSTTAVPSTILSLTGLGEVGVDLAIPDFSGEFLQQAWESRRLNGLVDAEFRKAQSLLLFVHPDHIVPRITLAEANVGADILDSPPPDSSMSPEPFDLAKSPTQTILVDLLQYVRQRTRSRRLPIAVLVSAWDLPDKQWKAPGTWLAQHLPLLDQFLKTNVDTLPSAVFGVSAQGATWPPPAGGDLLDKAPKDRPFCRDSTGKPLPDIGEPLRWLMRSI